MRDTNKKSNKILNVILIVLVVIGFGGMTYFYRQYHQLKTAPKTKQSDVKKAQELKKKLAKLMDLPDEDPVLGKVTDRKKLDNQPFFKNAKDGDDLIIFPKAKKAIIYRDSENKIINAGPIAITSTDKKVDDKKQ